MVSKKQAEIIETEEQIKDLEDNLEHGQEDLQPIQIIANREMRSDLRQLRRKLDEIKRRKE